jgi:hypothetical protein
MRATFFFSAHSIHKSCLLTNLNTYFVVNNIDRLEGVPVLREPSRSDAIIYQTSCFLQPRLLLLLLRAE